MTLFNNKDKIRPELGFGTKSYNKSIRFINEDGTVNIKRTGLGGLNNIDIYHWLINISLPKLIVVILSSYTIVNSLFALAYYLIGTENFGGITAVTEADKFLTLVFFSAQTLTTVGYGHVYPISHYISIVSAIESLIGLLGFALATGLLYGRFSRPKADLLFSKNILIAPYDHIKGLMFRITNKMQYELIESEATVTVSYNDPETKKREFEQLKLEINKIDFLALSWTIVHPITDESPLKGLHAKDLIQRDAEFLILIRAVNDTFSQSVHSRYSYKAIDIVENAKFKPLKQEADRNGRVVISVTDIHKYDLVK
jgi:inward rectifier potassium channel